MKCNGSKEENIAKADSMVRKASATGARLIVLPELFHLKFFTAEWNPEHLAFAEGIQGETVGWGRNLARQLKIYLFIPFFEQSGEKAYFNNVALASPDGDIVGSYRKQYIPFNPHNIEKRYFTSSFSSLPVFVIEDIKVAIIICYERHFPELCRIAALKGAHLMVIPSATQEALGRNAETWKAELITRAYENGMYVIGVNRCGMERSRRFFGRSVLIDPYGTIVAQLGAKEGIIAGDISTDHVQKVRADFGILQDIKPAHIKELLDLAKLIVRK